MRREVLHVCALATGLADKAVSLLYERVLRGEESKRWVDRCRAQIAGVLAVLEDERAQITTRAPSSTNRRTVAAPIPLAPPVMIATLPSSSAMFVSRSCSADAL